MEVAEDGQLFLDDPFALLRDDLWEPFTDQRPCERTQRLLDVLSNRRQVAGQKRKQEEKRERKGPRSLQDLLRRDHYATTGELICPDGRTVAGTALRNMWQRGGWQALDDAFYVGDNDLTAVVRGRLPDGAREKMELRRPRPQEEFLVYAHGTTLRIDSLGFPEFWMEVDLATTEAYRQLAEENASLRAEILQLKSRAAGNP